MLVFSLKNEIYFITLGNEKFVADLIIDIQCK